MRSAINALLLFGVLSGLSGCSWQTSSVPPQAIATSWDAPNFRTLLQAVKACQHPDLEEDADCAERSREVREALLAVEFCLHTSLPLYACRSVQRKIISQHAQLLDAARLLRAFERAEKIELRSYYPVTNKWLSAEWRWKDRGTLIKYDKMGFALAASALGIAAGGAVLAFGQVPLVRFRSKSQKMREYMERVQGEALEQIQIRRDEERRWLVLLHVRFEAAGIDRFPVDVDHEILFSELWTAGLSSEHCGKRDVVISDRHRPTGVQLVVTSVPSGPEGEGWRFHVHFGEVQNTVGCKRPSSLLADPTIPDWSEFRTFQEIPWERADVALEVARRLLIRAMRGTELLHRRGAAVPKAWQPYPDEIPLYLSARLPEDIDGC
jgi:hypothetical protein